MTKQAIKRLVYFHASLVLSNALDGGWEIETLPGLESEKDQDQFLKSMRELIQDMCAKGEA